MNWGIGYFGVPVLLAGIVIFVWLVMRRFGWEFEDLRNVLARKNRSTLRAAAGRYWSSLKAERGAELVRNWLGRLALINILGFFVLTQYFGGDAINGHEADGHFFLKMGRRPPVEVSEDLYRFMYWYAIVLLAHFGIVGLISWLHSRKQKAATRLSAG